MSADRPAGAEAIRIVVAHPHFTYPGGASAVILETGHRLAQAGDEVHVVSLRHSPELTAAYPEIRFHDLGGPLSSDMWYWLTLPAVYRRYQRLVEVLRPAVVVASVFPANYWAFMDRLSHPGVPCVWFCQEPSAFVHDWGVIRGVPWPMRAAVIVANPVLQVVDRWLARGADAIMANSRYSAGRIRRVYGREATVVRLGVNAARFRPETPKERLIVAVARLTRFKRIDIVIEGAAILRQQCYRDVRWIVVGDGEEAPALRQLASRLAVDDIVTFVGRLSARELTDLFNRALVVAVTAIGEPFGLVPLEAMAAGAVVVGSDSGGPAETIRDGVTGHLFRSGDAADFARRVAAVLDNPVRATNMAADGYQLVVKEYAWERTAEDVSQVLRRARSARYQSA